MGYARKLRRPGLMIRQKRGPESAENGKIAKDVDCEIGCLTASLNKNAAVGLKPKEKLQSVSFRELYLMFAGSLSYRDTTDAMNQVLHRTEDNRLRATTLENRVESFGMSLSEGYMEKAEEILESYGIDKASGMITENTMLPDSFLHLQLPALLEEKKVRSLITDYNRDRDSMLKLKYGKVTSCIETSTERCCYIRIDDVNVKYQKSRRKGKGKKCKKYVANTVIHIEADGMQYTITAVGMRKAFKLLVAFLLNNNLMDKHRLIFLTDGATCIRDNISKYFGFRQYTLILDWLHLKKKCGELLSMAIKGSKAEKNGIRATVGNILWTGRYEKAIKYLNSLKNSNIKNSKALQDVKDYINRKSPNITCYAIRHELGLPISSNRVEKANDIVVAKRQKHNGMSWSDKGSNALAIIKAAEVNGELREWITNKALRFGLCA